MQAIVLAGGKGTRLRSAIGAYPKPMADINGKPFLCIVLDWLKSQGVDKTILAVSYKHEIIQSYFGNDYKGMAIEYTVEESPLGTGGAIKVALEKVNKLCESAYVVNGDTYFPCMLSDIKLFEQEEDTKGLLTVALKQMDDTGRYGTVKLDSDSRIVKFSEKKGDDRGYINAGIYLIHTDLLSLLPSGAFSFEEFIENNCSHLAFYASKVRARDFIDIGIPEDYEKAKSTIG